MQLSQSIKLRQKQSLVMTPQLQQAIKLLQMTNLELSQHLQEQMYDNPFLEVTGATETALNETAKQTAGPADGEQLNKNLSLLKARMMYQRYGKSAFLAMIRPSIRKLKTGLIPRLWICRAPPGPARALLTAILT